MAEDEPELVTNPDGSTYQIPIDTSKPNPNGFEFDNLYLDMNGIVHPCTHPEGKPAPETEEEMMREVMIYTDRVVSMARPRRVLMMAIDGVAPRAKMNQQRSRRFRSAQEAKELQSENQRAVAELEARGLQAPEAKKAWDSNAITPGTPFMDLLAKTLRYWVAHKMNTDPGWAHLQVIISDASVPGEGEHKIMDFIRRQRSHSQHDANTHHVIYGLDADLIMLALATHEPHFHVLREDVFAQDAIMRGKCRLCGQGGHVAKDCTGVKKTNEELMLAAGMKPGRKPFIFLDVAVLREYLEIELNLPGLPFAWDLERAIDDWVFLIFFVGNDFLPHLPSLEIREGAIDTLLKIWKTELPRMKSYITNHGTVQMDSVQVVLQALAQEEDAIFRRRKEQDERQERRMQEQQDAKRGAGAVAEARKEAREAKRRKTDAEANLTLGDHEYVPVNFANGKHSTRQATSMQQKPIEPADTAEEANKSAAQKLKAQLAEMRKKALTSNKPKQQQEQEGDEEVKAEVDGIDTNAEEETDVKLTSEPEPEQEANGAPDESAVFQMDEDQSTHAANGQAATRTAIERIAADGGGSGPIQAIRRIQGESSTAASLTSADDTASSESEFADADSDAPPVTEAMGLGNAVPARKRLLEEIAADNETTGDDADADADADEDEVDEEDAPETIDPAATTLERKVNDDGTVEYIDTVKLWEPGYRARYYEQKFGVPLSDDEFRKGVMKAYMEGLCWVLAYYYQGCPSWQWYYPYHFAPFAADMDQVAELDIKFELGQPFRPFEQLMGVLPAASRASIPKVFHSLMLKSSSDIVDFYPEEFQIDMNGKKMAWQGVALLPFIDQSRLLGAMAEPYKELSEEEIRRNAFGTDVLCVSEHAPVYDSLCAIYAKKVKKGEEQEPIPLDASLTGGITGQVLPDPSCVPGSTYETPFENLEDMGDIVSDRSVTAIYFFPPQKTPHRSVLLKGLKKPQRKLNESDRNWIRTGGRPPGSGRERRGGRGGPGMAGYGGRDGAGGRYSGSYQNHQQGPGSQGSYGSQHMRWDQSMAGGGGGYGSYGQAGAAAGYGGQGVYGGGYAQPQAYAGYGVQQQQAGAYAAQGYGYPSQPQQQYGAPAYGGYPAQPQQQIYGGPPQDAYGGPPPQDAYGGYANAGYAAGGYGGYGAQPQQHNGAGTYGAYQAPAADGYVQYGAPQQQPYSAGTLPPPLGGGGSGGLPPPLGGRNGGLPPPLGGSGRGGGNGSRGGRGGAAGPYGRY